MIKRFQRRFFLLAMAALLLVLTLVIAGINIYNFHEIAVDADELLNIISDNHGHFPEFNGEPEPGDRGKLTTPGKKPEKNLGRLSPETPYETRYFSVGIVSSTGVADLIETSRIVAVNDDDAVVLARKAMKTGDDRGFIGEYRFYVAYGRIRTFVVFVDCGRTLESARRFLIGSIIISAAGYLLVCVIVAFLSRYAIRPAVAGYEKQRQFISNAGHELKTPLTIIRADADILEMDLGENEWLTDIRQQVQRLSDLTEELSKLSRMDEPNQPIYMKDLSISELLSEQAASFERVAKTKGMRLESSIQPHLMFRGNEKALRQLCSVLLDNAIKYSPDGAIIHFRFAKSGNDLSMEVDNPSKHPLPVDDLEQLFERFYRTDPSRNSETGGFGIGLSIARAIVESHNGTISARSKDGVHLTIRALLPCS